jgi:hypothetical protein
MRIHSINPASTRGNGQLPDGLRGGNQDGRWAQGAAGRDTRCVCGARTDELAIRDDGPGAAGRAGGIRRAAGRAARRSPGREAFVTCRTGPWAKVDEDERARPLQPALPGFARPSCHPGQVDCRNVIHNGARCCARVRAVDRPHEMSSSSSAIAWWALTVPPMSGQF